MYSGFPPLGVVRVTRAVGDLDARSTDAVRHSARDRRVAWLLYLFAEGSPRPAGRGSEEVDGEEVGLWPRQTRGCP